MNIYPWNAWERFPVELPFFVPSAHTPRFEWGPSFLSPYWVILLLHRFTCPIFLVSQMVNVASKSHHKLTIPSPFNFIMFWCLAESLWQFDPTGPSRSGFPCWVSLLHLLFLTALSSRPPGPRGPDPHLSYAKISEILMTVRPSRLGTLGFCFWGSVTVSPSLMVNLWWSSSFRAPTSPLPLVNLQKELIKWLLSYALPAVEPRVSCHRC